MLSLRLPQQRHGLFRPKAPYNLFLFLLLPLLPHRQHCFQGGDHGRSIGFPDPGSKPDLICLHGNSSLYDPGNFLLLFRCILRLIRDLDHIALTETAAVSKGDLHTHAGRQFSHEPFRYFVLERPVYLLMGDIYNDICISACYHLPLSFKISAIRTLSSMGYFTPLIS